MRKIDIHNHILPGLDDGAANKKTSLQMLRMAAEDGITHLIATPHFHYRRGHAAPEQIRNTLTLMQEMADEEGIPVHLYAGNELYYTHDLLEIVKAKEALTLADSEYVLLEFSPETEQRKIQNAVYHFLSEGYYPVIAHMERYQAFYNQPDFVETILRMGAYYQVNAGSITGNAGWALKRFTRRMMKYGMVQFVATDAHDLQKRQPNLSAASDWIEKKLGESEMRDYMYENPLKILENKAL